MGFSQREESTGRNIPNSALQHSSIQIGSTAIQLGVAVPALAGLTSVTSSVFNGAGTGLTGTASGLGANVAGGTANQIPVQTGTSATSFITAPSTAATYLQWTGTAFTWTGVASGISLSAATTGTYYPVFSSTGTDASISSLNSSTTKFTFDAATGTVGAVSFNATSTKRVKSAITSLSSKYLDRFKNLAPREYDRKDYSAHEFGFIAEEMELVYPELVSKDSQGLPSGIDYAKLSAILTAKAHEHQSMIETLQQQVAMLTQLVKGVK